MADEARTQSQQSVHKEANDKCSFAKISENNKDWCNGRGKQGKDALACVPKVSQGCETNKAHTDPHPTKSEWDSANAKPYKHTDDCSTKSEWDSANAKPYKHTDDCSTKSEWDSANAKPYKHTDDCSTKSEWDSAENLIDGADGEQSLR